MPDPNLVGIWIALVNGLALFITACIRKRRFDAANVGLAGVAFLSSFNLYPPIVLLLFSMDKASYSMLPPPLHGYEKYLSLAAFLSFLFTVTSIVSAYAKAWKPD